jgi:hypothetical protein
MPLFFMQAVDLLKLIMEPPDTGIAGERQSITLSRLKNARFRDSIKDGFRV